MNRRKHTGRSMELLFLRFALLFVLMLLQGKYPTLYAQPNIIRAEYFINTDPGFGNGTEITLPEGTTNTLSNHPFSVSTASLGTGIHQLFLRIKDANNHWSISNRTILYKAPVKAAVAPTLVKAEYYIDGDPGFGNGIPVPISPTGVLTDGIIQVTVNGLSNGTHRLYLRMLDDAGKWSITNFDDFELTSALPAPGLTLTGTNRTNLCAGQIITVGYDARGTFNPGNTFTVELSNETGSFDAPQTIGLVAATASGTIACTVPAGLAAGTGYRMRMVSSNPVVTSPLYIREFYKGCPDNGPLTVSLDGKTDVLCGGQSTGAINISISGGSEPYTIHWTKTGDAGFSRSTEDLTGIPAGDYAVTVTDDNGEAEGLTETVGGNPQLMVFPTVFPIACSVLGSIELTITGGTEAYTVIWDDGPTTTNRTGLTQGTYKATITDGSGCPPVIVEKTIDAPLQLWTPVTNAPYNSGIVNKTTGSSYDEFTFQLIYRDANDIMPAGAYPKLLLDYEGNGSMNDPNDREYTMYSGDLDADLTDGKLYTVTVEGLPYGTNYTARAVVFTALDCPVYSETYNGPDVVQAPNLQIFASDIRFSKYRTNPGETIEVTATIRNTSSEPADRFVVKLTSEFDPSEIFAEQTISVQPYGQTEVTWQIFSPADIASGQLIPMRVWVDAGLRPIAESNELDNNAVRAYINGNYEVPGRIETTLTPNSVFTTCAGNRISFSGHAVYLETGIDGMDGSSVAGASVQVTLENTGAVFSTVTNSLGNFTLNLPVLPAGTAYVLQGTTTDFTLIGNFTYQFGVSECPEPCTLPDLTVQLDFEPESIVQGGSTKPSVTVTNIGQSNAAATKLSVSYSGGPYGSQLLSLPPLATGESHTETINLVFPDAGVYTLYARANAGDFSVDPVVFRIDECTEANNNGFASIEVRPNLPDLIPYGAPKGTDYLCENPSRIITIYNKGGVAATNFNVRAKIIKDGAEVTSHVFTVASLDHGQSKELEIPFTYTTGTFSYEIEIDIDRNPTTPDGKVIELDETNNDSVYENSFIVRECLPDLIVEACPNNLVPTINPQEGGGMSIEATITNVGNAIATAPFNVLFLFSDPTKPVVVEIVSVDLAPGASATVTLSPTQVPPAGETVTITADAGEMVTELYENNNSLTVSLCHELQPVISCDNTLFGSGQKLLQLSSLTPWVPVRPNGSYLAQGVKVRFFVKTPASAVFTDLGIGTLSGTLNSCAACPAIVSLGTDYVFNETGTYTFRYVVDPDNEFDECNEGNNTLESQVEVSNAADMRIVSQYINPSKLNPALNEAVTFSITYENTGRSNVTDNMKLRLMVDDILLDEKSVGGLLSGDKQTVSFTDPAWSSNVGGLHIVRAIIDANDDVEDEADELNNEATRGIILGSAANLRIPQFEPDNAQPASGETITLTAEIVNDGDLGGEAALLFTFLSPGGNRMQIVRKEFSFNGHQTQTVSIDWPAIPNNATLFATIVDVSVLEYRTDDNEATTQIGNFAVEVVAADVICPNGSGSLQITPSGGTGNYSITIWENGDLKWQNNDASGQVIVELPAGTYLVKVRDNGSGQTIDKTCVINVTDCPTLLTVNITGTAMVTCYGSKTGSLTATPTEGTAPYTYLWSNGKSTQTISNLVAGKYDVTVIDADLNTATASHIILQPDKLTGSIVATKVSCFGDTNGKLQVNATSGTPGYTYSLDGIAFQASNMFENLAPGVYSVWVKDANGCVATIRGRVGEPALLTAGILSVVPTCYGSSTGSILVTVAGGTNPKTYAWTGPNGFTATTKNIRKLAPGMYYLTVTDTKGCTANTSAEVTSYNQYFSNPVVTNTTCRGGNDGAISLSPTGGSGTGFSAYWTGPNSFTSNNKDISGLKPGTYRLFLTDDGTGCVMKESITVGQPATSVSVSATISKISSCGGTGSILATATNGTAPYQYSINGVDFQGSGQFANLAAGTYTITAQDAIGCKGSRNFTVTDNGSDAYETNNARTAAKALSIATAIEARIGTTTDQDWFKFTSNATVIDYTIFMSHPSVAYSFDLYNVSGTLVAPASESLPDWKSYHLQANTAYYIRVAGTQSLLCYNLLVQAQGAPLITMLTAKPVIDTEPANALRTTAYPNPHNGNFTLEVNSPKSGEGHIILYDLQGRAVAERKEQFKAGLNQVRWTNMQVMPFVYRVIIGGENATGKILGLR